MHDFAAYIVLIIVTIAHLREIIAKLFGIRRDWKYSWLFYGQEEKMIVTETLKELGINADDIKNQIFNGKHKSSEDKKIELLEFLSYYMIQRQNEYGYETFTKSNYYINTMEAAQNAEGLKIMTDILYTLISKSIQEKIDFIITPKSGNPLLGKKLAEKLNIISILGKNTKDGAFAHLHNDDYDGKLLINYEGSTSLINTAKNSTTRKLKGILIDCNTSGGSQIMSIMDSFNDIVSNKPSLNISLLTDAFVLFRVDIDDNNIDSKFAGKGYHIHRWFDLSEEIKTNIWEAKKELKCQIIDSNNPKHLEVLENLIILLSKNKLLKQI